MSNKPSVGYSLCGQKPEAKMRGNALLYFTTKSYSDSVLEAFMEEAHGSHCGRRKNSTVRSHPALANGTLTKASNSLFGSLLLTEK